MGENQLSTASFAHEMMWHLGSQCARCFQLCFQSFDWLLTPLSVTLSDVFCFNFAELSVTIKCFLSSERDLISFTLGRMHRNTV